MPTSAPAVAPREDYAAPDLTLKAPSLPPRKPPKQAVVILSTEIPKVVVQPQSKFFLNCRAPCGRCKSEQMHGIAHRNPSGFVFIECYKCSTQAWQHWGSLLKVRRCVVRIQTAKTAALRAEAIADKMTAEKELRAKLAGWERKRYPSSAVSSADGPLPAQPGTVQAEDL